MPAPVSTNSAAILDAVSTALVVTTAEGVPIWRNTATGRLCQDLGLDWAALPLRNAEPDAPPVEVRCPARVGPRFLSVRCQRLTDGFHTPNAGPHGRLLYELADVTERRTDRWRADNYEWRLTHIERLAKVGSWEWDLTTQEVIWSPTLLSTFGLAPGETLDYDTYRSLLYPDDIPLIESTLEKALSTAKPFSYTHRMYLADRRTLRIFECYGEVFTDDAGAPCRVLGTAHDITEARRIRDELAYLADHDPLTGLPNRRALTNRMRELCASTRTKRGALLLIDIDNFKDINDLRGHAVGDEVMRLMSRLLTAHLAADTVVGRLGGDEFAVLLPGYDAERAMTVASRLCDLAAGTPLAVRGGPLRVTLSIGAAICEPDTDQELVLAHADLALYQAKGEGRNRARLFSPEQHRQAAQRVDVVSRVRHALDTGRLQLDAQPIHDLDTGAIHSYELLVRVCDGRQPQLVPTDFLPALERGDLVCELDRWVVERAIAALTRTAGGHGPLRLDVNISSRSLEDPDFGDWVVSALHRSRVPAPRLGLEITETTAIANLGAARRLAATLTSAGCGFILDDFGAGYGSFVYLKHLPFSSVKIDGEFVRQADHGGSDPILIDAVVRAAHGLGMCTVAEHVDRPELVPVLRRLGVDRGQGFHLGRPERLDALVDRLTSSLDSTAPIA